MQKFGKSVVWVFFKFIVCVIYMKVQIKFSALNFSAFFFKQSCQILKIMVLHSL